MVDQTCDLLGITSTNENEFSDPQMVGLAGPGGAGKSTVASMITRRPDDRANFPNVLWMPVG